MYDLRDIKDFFRTDSRRMMFCHFNLETCLNFGFQNRSEAQNRSMIPKFA